MFTRKDEFTYRKEIEELRMALGNKEKECRLRIRDEALDHKNAALVMRAEHQNEMHNLRGEQMVKLLEVQEKLAAAEAKSEEMEKRFAMSDYKKLSEILQALVVKLPTVDLKGINVNVDGKE